ncbi:hypothetical protein HK097_005954, partial [Rhizophlyctis rosea]
LYGGDFKKPAAFVEEWKSKSEYAGALHKIKKAIENVVGTRVFDPNRPVIIACDGSGIALGAMAGHAKNPEDDNNLTAETLYLACAYLSRKLHGAERNYSQPEGEFLAIIYALLKNSVSANKRVEKWRMCIALFPLDAGYPQFIFRAGKKQKDVDPLSRIEVERNEDSPSDLDEYIEELVMDPMEIMVNLVVLGWEPYDDILRWLSGAGLDHLDFNTAKKIRRQALKYCIVEDRLYRRVAPGGALRKVSRKEELSEIMEEVHGGVLGHLSKYSTYHVMSQRLY